MSNAITTVAEYHGLYASKYPAFIDLQDQLLRLEHEKQTSFVKLNQLDNNIYDNNKQLDIYRDKFIHISSGNQFITQFYNNVYIDEYTTRTETLNKIDSEIDELTQHKNSTTEQHINVKQVHNQLQADIDSITQQINDLSTIDQQNNNEIKNCDNSIEKATNELLNDAIQIERANNEYNESTKLYDNTKQQHIDNENKIKELIQAEEQIKQQYNNANKNMIEQRKICESTTNDLTGLYNNEITLKGLVDLTKECINQDLTASERSNSRSALITQLNDVANSIACHAEQQKTNNAEYEKDIDKLNTEISNIQQEIINLDVTESESETEEEFDPSYCKKQIAKLKKQVPQQNKQLPNIKYANVDMNGIKQQLQAFHKLMKDSRNDLHEFSKKLEIKQNKLISEIQKYANRRKDDITDEVVDPIAEDKKYCIIQNILYNGSGTTKRGGALNKEISQLTKEVKEFNGLIDQLTDDNNNIQQQIDNIDTDELEQQVEVVVNELQQQLDKIQLNEYDRSVAEINSRIPVESEKPHAVDELGNAELVRETKSKSKPNKRAKTGKTKTTTTKQPVATQQSTASRRTKQQPTLVSDKQLVSKPHIATQTPIDTNTTIRSKRSATKQAAAIPAQRAKMVDKPIPVAPSVTLSPQLSQPMATATQLAQYKKGSAERIDSVVDQFNKQISTMRFNTVQVGDREIDISKRLTLDDILNVQQDSIDTSWSKQPTTTKQTKSVLPTMPAFQHKPTSYIVSSQLSELGQFYLPVKSSKSSRPILHELPTNQQQYKRTSYTASPHTVQLDTFVPPAPLTMSDTRYIQSNQKTSLAYRTANTQLTVRPLLSTNASSTLRERKQYQPKLSADVTSSMYRSVNTNHVASYNRAPAPKSVQPTTRPSPMVSRKSSQPRTRIPSTPQIARVSTSNYNVPIRSKRANTLIAKVTPVSDDIDIRSKRRTA